MGMSAQTAQLEGARRLESTERELLAHAFDRTAPLGSDGVWTLDDLDAVEELANLERLAIVGREMLDTMRHRILPQPMRAARRISAALIRLDQCGSVAELLRAVPGEFGVAGDFDRVLVSTIEGSHWIPQTWWARDAKRPQDHAIVASLQGSRMSLASGMVEAEVVRRRAPAHVRDTNANLRTWAPFSEIAEAASYIAAPVVVGDRVAGLLHVDTGVSERSLGDTDVALVSQFADGLGVLLESLALRQRFDAQARKIQEALAAASEAVSGVVSGPLWMQSSSAGAGVVHSTEGRDAAVAQRRPEDKLTARERDVFDLLVGGATNAQIADRLTVSETTVKSHVQHILRKLGASNRSQVIAQYLRSADRGGA